MIQYQILRTNIMGIVQQTVRRIPSEILEVRRLKNTMEIPVCFDRGEKWMLNEA